eukprot:TRINITY_DN225_c0_g1_i1.p1 TRINITY_DN225_c0_g1~~TRINITY_DN225_c0_g1_i1.p1  ORF type:complete len:112 (-),score=19.93 TRINITY_DN225_c0_g1_i1:233-568(-)
MGFTDITTVDAFNDAIKNSKMAVIHFCSPTHSTCEKVDPELDELSTNQKVMGAGIVFFKVDLPLASDVVTASKVVDPPQSRCTRTARRWTRRRAAIWHRSRSGSRRVAGLF